MLITFHFKTVASSPVELLTFFSVFGMSQPWCSNWRNSGLVSIDYFQDERRASFIWAEEKPFFQMEHTKQDGFEVVTFNYAIRLTFKSANFSYLCPF